MEYYRFSIMIESLQELNKWWDKVYQVLNDELAEPIYKPLENYFTSFREDGFEIAYNFACGMGVYCGANNRKVKSAGELYDIFFRDEEE